MAVWMAACTTTVTTSSGAVIEAPPGAEQVDIERRVAVRMELAGMYYSRGQYDIALNEIKAVLQSKPNLGPAYALRGLVYSSMGDEALADDNFNRALQINPRDGDTLHNRGWFLCQRNRFAEADQQFEQALALPQYRDAQRTLLAQGVCLARAGKLEEAERKLSRAYELDPANPTTAFNLAEVLYRRGELERARFYARRVNQREEFSNAQTLWLALRIENRMGNRNAVDDYGRQLRNRFPQASETLAYERGRLDD
ncbi:MAG TPA: type IV pilus biogenesis/stability protein PilW [Burkholderiaceae bacterium]